MHTSFESKHFLSSNDGIARNEEIEKRLDLLTNSRNFSTYKGLLYHLEFSIVSREINEYLERLGDKSRSSVKMSQSMMNFAVYNALSLIDLAVDEVSCLMSYRHSITNEWIFIRNASIRSFAEFIVESLSDEIDSLADKSSNPATAKSKIVASLVEMAKSKFICKESFYRSDALIQFKDCYIENSSFIEGRSSTKRPRFYVARRVWPAVSSLKTSKDIEAVDLVLDYLSNHDSATLLYNLSLFMHTSVLDRLAMRPRAIVIVNKDELIKERLFDLLSYSIGLDNCRSVPIHDLDDSREIVSSLCLIIKDLTKRKLHSDRISIIRKTLETSRLMTRCLESNFSIRPFCSIATSSNDQNLVSSLNESDRQRFAVMHQDSSFIECFGRFKFDEVIRALKSEEAAQYLLERIIITHLTRDSAASRSFDSIFRIEQEFVDTVGTSKILGFSVKEVKELYYDWIDHEHIADKDYSRLEAALKSMGFIKKKTVFTNVNSDSIDFEYTKMHGPAIEFWIYSDKYLNELYFNSIREQREDDYRPISESESNKLMKNNERLKLVKRYITQFGSVEKRPVTDVYIDFHNRMGIFLDEAIGRQHFNKLLEQLGYMRKNITLSKVIMSDKDREIAKFNNTRMVRCWIKADSEE